jgi:hypothetical protein
MMRNHQLLATSLLLVCALSCSSGSSGTSTASDASFGAQYCAFFAKCCAAEDFAAPGESCQSEVDAASDDTKATAEMKSDCLAAITKKQDLAEFCYLPFDGDISACHDILADPEMAARSGAQDNAKICSIMPACCPNGVAIHCQDSYCDSATGSCVPYIAIGESCIGGQCIKEAYCDTVTWSCAARNAVGSNCADSSVCAEGAYCNSEKVCADWLPYGSACDATDACRPGTCNSQSICTAWKNHASICGATLG